MGDPKISNYKSSTILRAICFFGLGIESTLMATTKTYSVESIIFAAVYAFGLYVSKTKDIRQLQIFGGLAVVSALVRVFFDIGSYSTAGVKITGPTVTPTPRGGKPAGGTGVNFTGLEQITIINGLQLVMGAALMYLSYNIWKE